MANVPDRPRYGSVESFEDLMRRLAGEQGLYPYALGAIEGIVTSLHTSDADKVQQIKNALTAVGRIDKRAADTGLDYSRPADGDEPQPVAGRVPPHFEDGRTGEVVADSEQGEFWCPGRAAAGPSKPICGAEDWRHAPHHYGRSA